MALGAVVVTSADTCTHTYIHTTQHRANTHMYTQHSNINGFYYYGLLNGSF